MLALPPLAFAFTLLVVVDHFLKAVFQVIVIHLEFGRVFEIFLERALRGRGHSFLIILALVHSNLVVQLVNVSKCVGDGAWHLLIQVLVALARPLNTRQNKVVGTKLVDVVVEPGQIKSVETKANQVEQRLDVVDGSGPRVHAELAHRGKHGIAFEGFNWAPPIYSLSECKVDEVVPALIKTNVIQLDVPVAEAH